MRAWYPYWTGLSARRNNTNPSGSHLTQQHWSWWGLWQSALSFLGSSRIRQSLDCIPMGHAALAIRGTLCLARKLIRKWSEGINLETPSASFIRGSNDTIQTFEFGEGECYRRNMLNNLNSSEQWHHYNTYLLAKCIWSQRPAWQVHYISI